MWLSREEKDYERVSEVLVVFDVDYKNILSAISNSSNTPELCVDLVIFRYIFSNFHKI